MKSFFKTFFLAIFLMSFGACNSSASLDRQVAKYQGVVPLEDNGAIEQAFMWGWEMLTGNELGYSLEDLAMLDGVPVEIVVMVLQNYVETTVENTGMSRKAAIENVLYKAGYDKTSDGKIVISDDDEIDAKRKIKKSKDRKKTYKRNTARKKKKK